VRGDFKYVWLGFLFLPFCVEDSLSIDPSISVGSEVVALGLNQISWQPGAPKRVKVRQRGTHRWSWNGQSDGCLNKMPPSLLSLEESFPEKRSQDQVRKLWVLPISSGDVVQESSANDASTAPDARDFY